MNLSLPSPATIRNRLVEEFLAKRLIDNNLRGYWCEAMVAEALGPACKIVSDGWHAWDLQIGPDEAELPDRVRIQVKNSARIQPWNLATGKLSDSTFHLTYRRRPFYFERDYPRVPCEEFGFMCDVFILCHHPLENPDVADHLDPDQWDFFILPVVGPKSAVTQAELNGAHDKLTKTGKLSSTQRKPRTLVKGIRGRPPILPVGTDGLTIDALMGAVSED